MAQDIAHLLIRKKMRQSLLDNSGTTIEQQYKVTKATWVQLHYWTTSLFPAVRKEIPFNGG